MSDALALSSALSLGAAQLYTVDGNMARYKGYLEVITLRGQ